MWVIGQAATSGDLFSYVPDYQSLKHCELTKKACDDPIIKQLVDKRGDAWVVVLNAFKFGDDVKTKTQKNSEDNQIRCMDVIHRMYHQDDDLQGRIQGGALGAEAPPFIFRLYLINMLSIIMKFCLSIII